ncbi:glycosyltransferase family 4 protein [Haliangium sp.]|uniref:glycosyltransferase family 4 protein n=1 Tax=Haliangium sp. TaxID=2663208 RepID=UPI003D0F93E0
MDDSIVYASFDRVPAPKGAAVHIEAFVRALGRAFAPVELFTLAPPADPASGSVAAATSAPGWRHGPQGQRFCAGVTHYPVMVSGRNLIERAMHFETQMLAWWGRRRAAVAHVRSIYEGYALARSKGRLCRGLVYEVNGLPSIELKYHHPAVAGDRELVAKLRAQEQTLLEAADLVLTPSAVTAAHLVERGVAPARLRVIPNGVDLDRFRYRAPAAPGPAGLRVLYSGTLTSWQGVGYAIEAVALYCRDHPATLTVVGPGRSRQRRRILDECQARGLGGAVEVRESMSQAELAALHHEHDVILAPLPPNDRNLVQGCCPLKIIEAMATGTPLVASDMPVVRDLAEDGRDALLVKPGSAKAIKDALLRLGADPALGQALSRAARARVEQRFTWARAEEDLIEAYESVLGLRRRQAA